MTKGTLSTYAVLKEGLKLLFDRWQNHVLKMKLTENLYDKDETDGRSRVLGRYVLISASPLNYLPT